MNFIVITIVTLLSKHPLNYEISGSFQAELIKTAVTSCYKRAIRVHSLTFDGCAANISSMKSLAESLDDTVCKFPHPCGGPDVYIILDACHMIKLARNALCKCHQYLFIPDVNIH